MCTTFQNGWTCNFYVNINKLHWLYFINLINLWQVYCINFDFILPIVSVGIGEVVDSLKEGEKLVGGIALLINGDVVKDSVSI